MDPEKMENEDGSQETAESQKMSEELKKMAENVKSNSSEDEFSLDGINAAKVQELSDRRLSIKITEAEEILKTLRKEKEKRAK